MYAACSDRQVPLRDRLRLHASHERHALYVGPIDQPPGHETDDPEHMIMAVAKVIDERLTALGPHAPCEDDLSSYLIQAVATVDLDDDPPPLATAEPSIPAELELLGEFSVRKFFDTGFIVIR